MILSFRWSNYLIYAIKILVVTMKDVAVINRTDEYLYILFQYTY